MIVSEKWHRPERLVARHPELMSLPGSRGVLIDTDGFDALVFGINQVSLRSIQGHLVHAGHDPAHATAVTTKARNNAAATRSYFPFSKQINVIVVLAQPPNLFPVIFAIRVFRVSRILQIQFAVYQFMNDEEFREFGKLCNSLIDLNYIRLW